VLSCAGLGDEDGGCLGPPLRLGAEGRFSTPCPAGRPDRPSAGALELPVLGGEGTGDSPDARSGTRGCGLRRSRSPIPRAAGGKAGQASGGRRRRPGRAFFAPYSSRSWPPGASLDALPLLLAPRADSAAGVDVVEGSDRKPKPEAPPGYPLPALRGERVRVRGQPQGKCPPRGASGVLHNLGSVCR
jgi:hypothetical protein